MSGGSFDYAYQKLGQLDYMVSALDEMAAWCMERASDPHIKAVDDSCRSVDATLSDRSAIVLRGLMLERAANKLRAAVAEVRALEDIMHDVEWVVSGDYGVYKLMEKVR